MRRMRTWIGPSFRGEHLIGNRVVGKKGGKKVCQRPEDLVPDGTMELRVHGVNGGTPEQNLHDPSPVLITGDDTAGFYRRRKELQSGPKRAVEAYNWASINSKKSVRAWWLALFPFAAVNLAGWLLPKGLGGIRRGAAQVLVRLIALCVTVLGVLGLALVFVDLIGVQCAVIETCTRDFTWGWVGSIASWGPIGNIPVRLAVAYSLPPALLLLALWLIGRRGRQYENYGVGTTESKAAVGERIDDIRMNQVEFWQAPDVVYVQAWLHGAVAMGALAAVMAHSVRELVPHGQYHDLLYWLGIVGFGIVFAGTAAVGFVSGMKQIPRRWLRKQDAPFYKPRASWLPAGLSIALFGIVLWLGWFSKTSSPLDDQPPLDAIRNGLIIAAGLAVLLVVLLGCVVGASRSIIFVLFLGWAIVKVVARTGNAPGSAFEWNRLGGGGWLTVEALLAIAGVAWYAWWSRSTQAGHDPKDRQRNPVYIYGSTGVIVVCGIASYLRTDALWMLITALAIPVVYLAAQFVLQIRNGHDYPAKEQMREGTSAVVAGLGVTSVMTLISSGTVFVAQRLGTAYALPQFGFQLNGNQCPPNSICYPAEIGWFSLAAIAGVVVLVVSALLRLGLLYVARWRSKAGDLCLEYDLVRPEADRRCSRRTDTTRRQLRRCR